MSATVPITNGMMQAGGQVFQALGGGAEAPPVAQSVTGGMTEHNTSAHVGVILLAAGGLILALHLGGFRLAFDVGMGRG
jgi:hypothetical protein